MEDIDSIVDKANLTTDHGKMEQLYTAAIKSNIELQKRYDCLDAEMQQARTDYRALLEKLDRTEKKYNLSKLMVEKAERTSEVFLKVTEFLIDAQ